MPTEAISPADHTTILLSYDNAYRESRGADRQEVLQSIITEILAQYEVLPNDRATKGLSKVS